jgi:hypothetical protein
MRTDCPHQNDGEGYWSQHRTGGPIRTESLLPWWIPFKYLVDPNRLLVDSPLLKNATY